VNDDPGLARYRTRLAWRRTILGFTVVVILAVRLALPVGTVGALVTAAALAGWVAVIALAFPRLAGSPPPERAGPVAPLAALAVAGYAVLGTLLVVTR
jgi:hypothetical protein